MALSRPAAHPRQQRSALADGDPADSGGAARHLEYHRGPTRRSGGRDCCLWVGSGLGRALEPRDAARRLPEGRLWPHGEWLTLVQIALTISVRYVTNVVATMTPVLGAKPIWHVGSSLAAAMLSSVLLGRVAAKLRI